VSDQDRTGPPPVSGPDVERPPATELEGSLGRLVEHISDIVTLLSPTGEVLYQSPSIARVLGHDAEVRRGHNIFVAPIVHPDDLPVKRRFLQEAVEGRGEVRAEFRLRHADGSWRYVQAVGILDPGLGGVVATYRDVTEARKASAAQRFLYEAGRQLASSLDYESTLASVARLAVPEIADWCVVDLVDGDGNLKRVAAAHFDPAREQWAVEMAARYQPTEPGTRDALRAGESRLVSEITEEMLSASISDPSYLDELKSAGLRSGMTVPLIARGHRLGVVTFLTAESGRRLDERDLAVAEELAILAALAIENARLYQAAEHSRARLQDLFMMAPAIIAVSRGPDQVFELVNPKFVELLGERDFVGREAREAIPEADRQGVLDLADHVFRTGRPFVADEMRVELVGGDGKLREGYFNFVIQPTRDLNGAIDGTMVHAIEVTEQAQARTAIERFAAERNAMLAQMAEGVVIVDPTGTVTFMNDAAARMYGGRTLGYNALEMPESLTISERSGDVTEIDQTPLARALRFGETVENSEVRVRRADGSQVILQRSAAPVCAENGTLVGAVMTVRDVTALRTIEEQKSEFLTAAAHDLRTPLTTIKGLAQYLESRGRRDGHEPIAQHRDALRRIDSSASRMSDLIDEMLDVTRTAMNQPVPLKRRRTDIVRLVRTVAAELAETSRGHRVLVEPSVDRLTGLWDPVRLARCISNLINNAIRYSPDGGDVRVSIDRSAGENGPGAVIGVHDRGVGIAEEDLPRIFDRFYRGRNVAGKISGTGIGLAGARYIVQEHGGTIGVETEPDAGTTFTIRLPLRPPSSEPTTSAVASRS